MAESSDEAWGGCFVGWDVGMEDFVDEVVEVFLGIFVVDVEFEVHFGDGELAHDVDGTEVGAGGEHFFE